MTPTPIDALKPFTEPGDWRTMMATLVEPALRAQIAGQSQSMNEPWMRLIAEGGLLRLPDVCKELHQDRDAFIDGVEQWTQRLSDFTRFTASSSLAITTAANNQNVSYLVNGGPKGVQDIYAHATTEVVADYRALLAHPLAKGEQSVTDSVNSMALWLAGAIALDLPESVAHMVSAVPQVAEGAVPLSALGRDLSEHVLPYTDGTNLWSIPKGDSSVTLTAQGAALALSRESCLDALWAHGVSPLSKLGNHVNTEITYEKGRNESTRKVKSVEFFTDNLPLFIVPFCTPSVWEKTLKKTLDDPTYDIVEREALYTMAVGELVSDEKPWMALYMPAMSNAGVFRFDPTRTMSIATRVGASQVLDAVLPAVQWNDPRVDAAFAGVNSPFLMDAKRSFYLANTFVQDVRPSFYGATDEREACVLKVMAAAKAAGRDDLLTLRLVTLEGKPDRIEPSSAFTVAGFKRAIVALLENAADPKSNPPGLESMPTMLQYADENAPEIAYIIRTHEARTKAFTALDGVEKSSTPKPRPF